MTNIIVGLDIGTSSVRGVLGGINEDDSVEIYCVANKSSSGFVRNGAIVNVDRMKDVVKDVIDQLEQNFGYEVDSCVSGIGGKYIESMNASGSVPVCSIAKKAREITAEDVDRVLFAASAILIPPDRETLQVIPKEFSVNDVRGYKADNVLGTQAVRLGLDVHIVTASKTQLTSLTKCVEQAGYALDFVFLKTLAAAKAVMQKEEQELGSILIDLGGGTTDVIVIVNDAPACTVSIQAGGNLVTSDIAYMKNVPLATAEKLKIDHGCCWDELLIDNDIEIVIPAFGGRPPELITKSVLCKIIQSRMQEIFSMVRDEIVQKLGIIQLSGSIILTGGGALMNGVVELAQYTFKTSSVRIGMPGQLGGVESDYRSPEYATAVGLVLSDRDNLKTLEMENSKASGRRGFKRASSKAPSFLDDSETKVEKPKGKSVFSKVKDWLF